MIENLFEIRTQVKRFVSSLNITLTKRMCQQTVCHSEFLAL